ncbi:MAG TPA: hypothetical protein V6C72_03560 [Chroococcales cyanobacterium]
MTTGTNMNSDKGRDREKKRESAPQHIRELEWLGRYFQSHGMDKEAEEISTALEKRRKSVEARNDDNVVDMFASEERQKDA